MESARSSTAIKLRWAQHVGFSEFLYTVISIMVSSKRKLHDTGITGEGGHLRCGLMWRGSKLPRKQKCPGYSPSNHSQENQPTWAEGEKTKLANKLEEDVAFMTVPSTNLFSKRNARRLKEDPRGGLP